MPTEKPTFEDLVEEHGAFVRRTLAHLGVSARDLADVEQEVFRGVDRGLPAFDPALSCNPDTAVRGWLFGICERQAASHRRAEIKRGEVLFATEELDFTASVLPSVEERLIDHERRALLEHLLNCLEPHRRAVVVAYELEGVAMTDVAAALAIPVNTAWNRLRLGREDLRTAWKRMARKEGRGLVKEGRSVVKEERDAPMLSLASLFGGAEWCSNPGLAGEDVGSSAEAQSAPVQPAPTVPVPPVPAPSAVVASASSPVFGLLALGVPLGLAGALVLGAGEEPPALPVTERPAAVVVRVAEAPEEAPSPVKPDAPRGVDAPPVLASTVTLPLLGSLEEGMQAVHSRARMNIRGASAGAPAAPSVSATSAPMSRGLELERSRIQEAAQALESGDVRAAKAALDLHQRQHAEGRLAGERELLAVRLLLTEGRRNEACDRVRRFVAKHPDSPFRAQLEAAVAQAK